MSDPADLAGAFGARFGGPPDIVVRAPGRVNLIGEHTDYSLLPVLPTAIDRSVLVAASQGSDGVIEADSLAIASPFRTTGTAELAALSGWHRYVAAAVESVGQPTDGARLLIGGDLPFEGGLSSSSALTLAIIAALNALWELGMDEDRLISSAIAAERATGVEGGMMDQIVIVKASSGTALRISFDPVQTRPVSIPDAWSLVVAHSGRSAPKGETAKYAYNRLVVACRASAALLGGWAELDAEVPPSLHTVAGVPEVMDLVADLPAETTAAAVAQDARIPIGLLVGLTRGEFDVNASLPVKAAATHVLTEAVRVDEAVRALDGEDLDGLGLLLDQSQASLEALGVSTAELDQLAHSMRLAGAAGGRLTGAGFGGFALAMCSKDSERKVIAAGRSAAGGPAFAVQPSAGLSVL